MTTTAASSTTLTTIDHVTAHEVVVPVKPGATDSPEYGSFMDGTPWPDMPIVLLEVRFSDGVVGLGEVGRGQTIRDLEPWLRQLPGLALPAMGFTALPQGWRTPTMAHLLTSYPNGWWLSPSPVLPALEMAALDAVGKRLGCRVVDLLGGAYRERVAVDYWAGRQTPKDLARTAAKARELGFHGIKTKSRAGDPAPQQLRAIKEAAGEDFAVTIDPMFQWLSPHQALSTFKAMEPWAHRVQIEDPFPQDQPEYWQRVRQVSSIPLIWHGRGITSLRRALQDRCADDFNCAGTVFEFLIYAHAVEVMGHSCWHGSSIEMGVGQVAHLHAAAAARACVLPSDFVSGLIREHTLITWDWPYADGHLPLPEGPGLGVELDRAALKRYSRAEASFAGE